MNGCAARAEDYLLDGVRLAEARALDHRKDVATQNADARELIDAVPSASCRISIALQREQERRREAERLRDEADRGAQMRSRIGSQ